MSNVIPFGRPTASKMTFDPRYNTAEGQIGVGDEEITVHVSVWSRDPNTAEVDYYGYKTHLIAAGCATVEQMQGPRPPRFDAAGFKFRRNHRGNGWYRVGRKWPVDRAHTLPGIDAAVLAEVAAKARKEADGRAAAAAEHAKLRAPLDPNEWRQKQLRLLTFMFRDSSVRPSETPYDLDRAFALVSDDARHFQDRLAAMHIELEQLLTQMRIRRVTAPTLTLV